MSRKSLRIREKYSLWVRWTHGLNFLFLSLMVWSGILIYWANDVYRPFFPEWFYDAFHVDHRLAQGMAWHFAAMWGFALNGLAYVAYLAVSGEWRELWPRFRDWRAAPRVALHDLGLAEEPPRTQGIGSKLNSAQKIAYTGVVAMGAGSLLTGLAIYKPIQLHGLAGAFGGYERARFLHFALTLGYVGFFVVHVAQVARAGWNNFRSIVAGFEVADGSRK